VHGQPRDHQQIRADAARRLRAQVLLLQRHHHAGRRGRVLEDGSRGHPSVHRGRGEARSVVGSEDCRDAAGARHEHRAPHRRQVSRAAQYSSGALPAPDLATTPTRLLAPEVAMKIQMTGRHLTVPAPVKRRLAERLEKLTRWVPELSEAQVKLSAQKYRHQAEILIHVRHTDHVSRAEAGDLESAIDAACDRLEAQVRKLKEKKSKKLAAHRAPDGPLRRSAARAALLDTAKAETAAARPGNGKAPRVTVGR